MTQDQFNQLCKVARDISGHDVRYTKSRRKEIIQVKSALINVMRTYCSASTLQLGRLFDMHHSTIIHHCKDHSSRYRFEDNYCFLYDSLVRFIMGNSSTISVDKMVRLMRNALTVNE